VQSNPNPDGSLANTVTAVVMAVVADMDSMTFEVAAVVVDTCSMAGEVTVLTPVNLILF